ncbi:MAG: hypothetical protein IPK17_12505 [Chloroflexi bacterium]|uniref:hypothetical protein n=1 Tax=Candidatus Flexifilum breve TaxID=3140694 RepID=UPI003136E6A5|nr:hypothetical protein [Chloroflexota bacterium]
MLRKLMLIAALLLAACDNLTPTLEPTRTLSAPTLASSPVVRPFAPEREPTALLNAGVNDPTAAALPRDSELPPLPEGTIAPGESRQPITVTAPDGTVLEGDLYSAAVLERPPGILMLAPERSAWLDLPLRLQAQGFTVLAINSRGAGQSNLATGDFAAMLNALSQLVDPGRLAVIGADSGADEGLAGCATDDLCDALAVLSPLDQTLTSSAILRYNPRPLFIAAGTGDAAFSVAQNLNAAARGTVQFQQIESAARGAALLQAQPALGDALIDWVQAQFP